MPGSAAAPSADAARGAVRRPGARPWAEELRAHWAVLAVGALTAVAFALRYATVHDSIAGDELFMFRIVHGHGLRDVLHVVRDTEKTPPLFFVLVWGAAKLGDPTLWLRAPSLFFGVLLVPVVYALGLRTVGRTAGVVAAAVVALEPFAIFYGVEARAYGALACLSAVSTLCLLWALDSGRRRAWLAYGLAVLAVLYTHYMGVFVLVAQALWAFWVHRERLRTLLVVHGLIVLAFLPWLSSFLVQHDHSADEARRIAALAPPSLDYLGQISVRMLLGHPFEGTATIPGRAPTTLALAVLAAGALVALAGAVRRRASGVHLASPAALLVLLALATPLGLELTSLRPDQSFMIPRNLSASLPAFALVAAWLLVRLDRRAAIPAIAVVLAVLVVGVVGTLDRDHRRTDYRGAAQYIEARARPGDPVVQSFFFPVSGPPGGRLAINFKRPHLLVRGGSPSEAAAWARGRRGAHVFTTIELSGGFKSVHDVPARAGPGKAFARVAGTYFPGLANVVVGEYAYRGP